MAKRKAKAPARKSSGSFWTALAGNRMMLIGLLGVIAIAALVLMLLQVM